MVMLLVMIAIVMVMMMVIMVMVMMVVMMIIIMYPCSRVLPRVTGKSHWTWHDNGGNIYGDNYGRCDGNDDGFYHVSPSFLNFSPC
jgi:hypothetical protein